MRKSDKVIVIIVTVFLIMLFVFLYTGIKSRTGRYETVSGSEKIALVELRGMITDSRSVVNLLFKYSKRSDIKGIVLRIDSPGGGVAPSQEIYEAVRGVRESGKPIIASFASAAASGGYYAALGATKIMSNPGSITGSIGVIVTLPMIYELLDKIGVKIETRKSGDLKDTGSPYRELNERDKSYLDDIINNLHGQFIDAVAKERNIGRNDLLKMADGRIFTGLQAFELGLVDTLGTLEDAISLTGNLAGIEGRPRVISEKKKKITLIDLLFSDFEDVMSIMTRIPTLNYLWK